jgi:hypothetical protein
MSDTQVKATPSKAAMELAIDIERYLGLQDYTKPIPLMIAKRIDLSLSDLLEKAEAVTDIHGEKHPTSCVHALAAALEPWKPK